MGRRAAFKIGNITVVLIKSVFAWRLINSGYLDAYILGALAEEEMILVESGFQMLR